MKAETYAIQSCAEKLYNFLKESPSGCHLEPMHANFRHYFDVIFFLAAIWVCGTLEATN